MKIITASTAGFCMGVRRAVDLALEQAAKSPSGVLTLGPLIHNNQTVEMLRERRIVAVDESKQVPPGSTILISAHGTPPAVQKSWEPRGHVIDGTCPKVKTVHKVIEKYRDQGFAIVIAGDKGHSEVVGLQGYAGYAGHLICLARRRRRPARIREGLPCLADHLRQRNVRRNRRPHPLALRDRAPRWLSRRQYARPPTGVRPRRASSPPGSTP